MSACLDALLNDFDRQCLGQLEDFASSMIERQTAREASATMVRIFGGLGERVAEHLDRLPEGYAEKYFRAEWSVNPALSTAWRWIWSDGTTQADVLAFNAKLDRMA